MHKQLDKVFRRAGGWPSGAALLLAFIATVSPAAAFAHILNVFAWVDGDELVVEGKFNTGKRPVGGDVTVLDGYDKQLLTTELQKDGTVRLPLPDYKSGLRIELSTSFGHDSYWILTPHDVETQRAKTLGEKSKLAEPEEKDVSTDEKPQDDESKLAKPEAEKDSNDAKPQEESKPANSKDGKDNCEKSH